MEALKVEKRELGTKGSLTKLRKEGFIPGILYGGGRESIPIYVIRKELEAIIHKKVPIFDIVINNKKESVFIKDKQIDPIKNQIIHVDLMNVEAKKKIEASIDIKPIGIPQGVKEGGILEQHIYQINIRCLPQDIKETLEVNVEGLNIGEMIYIADLPKLKGIEILEPEDKLIFSVRAPKEEKEEVIPEIEMAEPEVIKKGKKEKEEFEG